MTDTTISDATVFPQDEGVGVPSGSEDGNYAACFAALARYQDGTYVDSGTDFTSIDTTNETARVDAGIAFIVDDVSVTNGERSGNPTYGAGASTDTFDTSLPSGHDIPYVVVLPTETSNLGLGADTTNDIWLAVDPIENDSVYVRHGSGLSAPSDPSIKLGTVNSSDGSTTRPNDLAPIDVRSIGNNGSPVSLPDGIDNDGSPVTIDDELDLNGTGFVDVEYVKGEPNKAITFNIEGSDGAFGVWDNAQSQFLMRAFSDGPVDFDNTDVNITGGNLDIAAGNGIRDGSETEHITIAGGGDVEIPNGQLSEQGNRVATRTWTNSNFNNYLDSDAISAVNNDSDHGSAASHNYYTDSDAVAAVNAETSLSVDISGDADTLDNNHASDFASSSHGHSQLHSQNHDNSDHTTNYLPSSNYDPEGDTHSRYSDSEARSAIESGTISQVSFSNIESVGNRSIGIDDSEGPMYSDNNGNHYPLWNSNHVNSGNQVNISGGSGAGSTPVTISVNENGLDADSVDGYDIQVNGSDGGGIINFKT